MEKIYFLTFWPMNRGPGGGGFVDLLSLVMMLVILYFLLIRPQQKKAKKYRELLSNLKRGDLVITAGGIYGRIAEINENIITLEVADQVFVKVASDFVSDLVGTDREPSKQPPKAGPNWIGIRGQEA